MKPKRKKTKQTKTPHTAINIMAVAFMFIFVLAGTNCKDNNDPQDPPEKKHPLVGTGETEDTNGVLYRYTFRKDGTCDNVVRFNGTAVPEDHPGYNNGKPYTSGDGYIAFGRGEINNDSLLLYDSFITIGQGKHRVVYNIYKIDFYGGAEPTQFYVENIGKHPGYDRYRPLLHTNTGLFKLVDTAFVMTKTMLVGVGKLREIDDGYGNGLDEISHPEFIKIFNNKNEDLSFNLEGGKADTLSNSCKLFFPDGDPGLREAGWQYKKIEFYPNIYIGPIRFYKIYKAEKKFFLELVLDVGHTSFLYFEKMED